MVSDYLMVIPLGLKDISFLGHFRFLFFLLLILTLILLLKIFISQNSSQVSPYSGLSAAKSGVQTNKTISKVIPGHDVLQKVSKLQ